MTDYVGFFRPGEVTLLLEPADPAQAGDLIETRPLSAVHTVIENAGVALHATQFHGHAGERPAVVLTHCHRGEPPHVVHTVNLASWIPPRAPARWQRPAGLIRRLWARLTGGDGDGAVQPSAATNQQHQSALTDVLNAVNQLNSGMVPEAFRTAGYRLVRATPNWLATPAQAY